MKKAITLLVLTILFTMQTYAQTTNYKAFISDNTGAILANQSINVKFTIFNDDPAGAGIQVFQETHTTTTNSNGFITLEIGAQNLTDWYNIEWGMALHYLKTEYNTGSGFVDMGTVKFHFVPYAFLAQKSMITGYVEFEDVANKPTTLAGYGITDANDADWFISGTTNDIPTNIDDDIYHTGKITIGSSLSPPVSSMFYVSTLGTALNAIKTKGNVSNSNYTGLLNESQVYTSQTGDKTGVKNFIINNGNGDIKGIDNYFGSTNNSSKVYGINNNLWSTGNGIYYGNYTKIRNSGSGVHYGSYNHFTNGSGNTIGTKNEIQNGGSGHHHGIENLLFGSGTGEQIGVFNSVDNSGAISSNINHVGVRNYIAGTGGEKHIGTDNTLAGENNGEQIGTSNFIFNSGNGIHYGIKNELKGNGAGAKYGVYNEFSTLVSASNARQTGVRTKNINNGNGNHYGVENLLFGSSIGEQVGVINSIDNSGNGGVGYDHIAVKNSINGNGGYRHIGVDNILWGANGGEQIATKNFIWNTGNGVHYGTKNELSGSGTGIKYGVYSSIDQNAGGQHYAIYAQAEKANSFAGFFVGKTEFNGDMQVTPTAAGNPAIININNSGGDADLFINSSSSQLPTVTFRTNNVYRTSVGYSTTEDALFIYHNSNVFFKNGNIIPQSHISKNLGANGRAWNNVYAHNYVTQGSAAYTDRSVTTELLAHPPMAKKEGDFDAKSNGLYELNPNSLPKALHTENGLLIDEIATYNYKANYEQQKQINVLKTLVLEQQKQIIELIKKLKK